MPSENRTNRRELLTAGAAGLASLASLSALQNKAQAEEAATAAASDKVYRIGVVSARINGKPQKSNGHTWHFAQYFHPEVNLDAIARHLDPGSAKFFATVLRNPTCNFGVLPFADTKITHYYEPDPAVAALFCEAFPGVQVATSLEKMAEEVDAIWLGDASGYGEDHFDLLAPALAKGLPTFCDKPIGGSVAGTRKILEFARQHKAPLMSSSLFRHEWGMEEALRTRDSGEQGPLQYVLASMMGGYSDNGWLVYGQHPAWSVMTLCGPGVEAVSLYSREASAHSYITYADRMPAEIWYGRPDCTDYCETFVHFQKSLYKFTPEISGNFWYGHHYEMFNMARTFLGMVKTGVEPVPHREILEVTAMIHAGVKSKAEHSRLVPLAEVMG
jgi:predicted dehydrogenase